jgi:hypothetical protein
MEQSLNVHALEKRGAERWRYLGSSRSWELGE